MLIIDKTMSEENAYENLDSQNEEALEANNDDYASDSEDTTSSEDASEFQGGNDGDSDDLSDDNGDEPVTFTAEELKKREKEIRKSQDERWKKRIKEAKGGTKEAKNSRKEGKDVEVVSDALLARLESRGVLEPEDQEYVIKFASVEDISPVEALKDPLVRDKLAFLDKARKSKKASPSSSNRTSKQKGDDLEKAYMRFKEKGEMPADNKTTVALLKRLSKEG